MRRALALLVPVAAVVLCVTPPAYAAILMTNESPAGAVTFATFDSPTNTNIATVTGGSPCPGGLRCDLATSPTALLTVTLMSSEVSQSPSQGWPTTSDSFGALWAPRVSSSTETTAYWRASTGVDTPFLRHLRWIRALQSGEQRRLLQ